MLTRWLVGVLLVVVSALPSHADGDFLEPEQAFRFSAKLSSGGVLEVRYLIADGYYMYRDRFLFDVEPGTVVLGAARFPPGQWHEDEFFGRSEIFRGDVTIEIPIVSGMEHGQTIRLVAISQGCADAGICYLPTTQTMDLMLLGSFGATTEER
ncbi:MAG: protein-disulfide reductase DsbD N-terminal domain-containing protein [Betaproteobacteria bacterium]|nr:MAG: protein-disulfide reductase DsbD N-terminal domain-containing protein [Betaproteobacteria bacterium]